MLRLYAYTFLHLYLLVFRLYTSTPLHLYTSTPLHLYTSTPLRLYASTPLRLYASTPLHFYTSTPLRQGYYTFLLITTVFITILKFTNAALVRLIFIKLCKTISWTKEMFLGFIDIFGEKVLRFKIIIKGKKLKKSQ